MIKKLIGLVVALAVLAGLILFNKSAAKKSRRTSLAVDPSIKNQVQVIKISQGADTALILNKEGTWVTSDSDWPADTGKVNKVLEALFKLEDKEVVSRNPERVSEYGLDESSMKEITMYGDSENELYKAYIGKTSSADYNSTYWKKTGGDEVYRTGGNLSYQLYAKDEDWKDKSLYHFEKGDVKKLEVFWLDSLGARTEFTVQSAAGDLWEMTAPKQGGAKKNLVESMAGRFKQLSIDEFIQEGDTPEMSQSPTIDVRVTLADGTVKQLVAQRSGKHDYVKHPSRDDIVKLNTWRLDAFQKTVDELYEAPPEDSAAAPAEAVPQPAP